MPDGPDDARRQVVPAQRWATNCTECRRRCCTECRRTYCTRSMGYTWATCDRGTGGTGVANTRGTRVIGVRRDEQGTKSTAPTSAHPRPQGAMHRRCINPLAQRARGRAASEARLRRAIASRARIRPGPVVRAGLPAVASGRSALHLRGHPRACPPRGDVPGPEGWPNDRGGGRRGLSSDPSPTGCAGPSRSGIGEDGVARGSHQSRMTRRHWSRLRRRTAIR